MTKAEAYEKLIEWGLEPVPPDEDGLEPLPLIEDLLSFAESLAEKKWPGEDYRIALIFDKFGQSDETGKRYLWHAFSYATLRSPDSRQASDGRADDPWWAVLNLIQKMME